MTCCSIVGHLNILQFRLRDQNSFSTKPVIWHRVLTFWRLPYFHGFWHGCWWKLSKQNSMGNASMEQDLYWLIACNMFYTYFLGHLLFFSLVYPRVLPQWRNSNDSFFFLGKFQLRRKKKAIWKTVTGVAVKIWDTFQRNCGTQNKTQVSLSWWITGCKIASQPGPSAQQVKQLKLSGSTIFSEKLVLFLDLSRMFLIF